MYVKRKRKFLATTGILNNHLQRKTENCKFLTFCRHREALLLLCVFVKEQLLQNFLQFIKYAELCMNRERGEVWLLRLSNEACPPKNAILLPHRQPFSTKSPPPHPLREK